jgi:hypothetical protein
VAIFAYALTQIALALICVKKSAICTKISSESLKNGSWNNSTNAKKAPQIEMPFPFHSLVIR